MSKLSLWLRPCHGAPWDGERASFRRPKRPPAYSWAFVLVDGCGNWHAKSVVLYGFSLGCRSPGVTVKPLSG